MPYKNFLGYDKGQDGKPVINEKEAKIVRLIYRLFLQGKTASGICKHLDGLGIPTPTGKKAWNQTTVNSILRNEKYKGDALLQKENAGSKQSQSSYDKKYNSLVRKYEKADKRLTEVTQERDGRINRERELRIFISELAEKPLVIEEWDEELWVSILESATVHKDGQITFLFKNGTSIEVGAE